MVNAQYNVAAPDSVSVKIAGMMRRRMYERFIETSGIQQTDSVVDIGATSDRSYDHSNYLVAWYPWKEQITAVGIDDASFLERVYPGVKFLRGDGIDLPFADGSFDYAHSSAVLEHVGSAERQARFLGEMWRVARKGIFVTTPNRWFPIEFHTLVPLMHWLPAPTFRHFLRWIGRDFFAEEANLNLLTARSLRQAALSGGVERFAVETVALAGWPTNLLLVASKLENPRTGNSGRRRD